MAGMVEAGGGMATMRNEASLPANRKKRAVANYKEQRRKIRHTQMTVSEKISLLRDEGYKQKQAVAIALNMQRRGKLRKG